jgi:hypothetical protein
VFVNGKTRTVETISYIKNIYFYMKEGRDKEEW